VTTLAQYLVTVHRKYGITPLVCTGSRDAKTCNRLIAILDRAAFLRAAAMLSDPPPAWQVLRAARHGHVIESLVGGEPFTLADVRGVDLDAD
jgi:hypothetical protein